MSECSSAKYAISVRDIIHTLRVYIGGRMANIIHTRHSDNKVSSLTTLARQIYKKKIRKSAVMCCKSGARMWDHDRCTFGSIGGLLICLPKDNAAAFCEEIQV